MLFVGDAARAADIMTGEGIGQALLTGRFAAEAITTSDRRGPAAVASAYEARLRHHLIPDDRVARLLGHALKHRKGVGIPLRLVSTTKWTGTEFVRWLFEGYPRSALVRPTLWPEVRRRPAPYSRQRP